MFDNFTDSDSQCATKVFGRHFEPAAIAAAFFIRAVPPERGDEYLKTDCFSMISQANNL